MAPELQSARGEAGWPVAHSKPESRIKKDATSFSPSTLYHTVLRFNNRTAAFPPLIGNDIGPHTWP